MRNTIAIRGQRITLFTFAGLLGCVLLSGPAMAARGGKGSGGGQTYTLGGTATGLGATDSVTLQNNGDDDLYLDTNGNFVFASQLSNRESYDVTVFSSSAGLDCTVSNGSGKISKNDVTDVFVTCSREAITSYKVGGTLSGLGGGTAVTLQNNGGDDLTLTNDGAFSFVTALADGATYTVKVTIQPDGQICDIANGVGSVSGSDVSSIVVNCSDVVAGVGRLEGAGDSIMRGYNASCTGNTDFLDLFCYSGGDQNENSFLDGASGAVYSMVDYYREQNPEFSGGKSASASGSEMRDPDKNNFATQAAAIVQAATQPVTVLVELGGNDLCNRTSETDFYTDAQWQEAVDAGLQIMVEGLPVGSSVLLSGVPRVQDLRAVGIMKQNADSRVNCESFWASWDVCTIATASDAYLEVLDERQRRYNEILAERAAAFNAMALQTGVEVAAEYQGENFPSVGTFQFTPQDINGGDCFHPSLSGQGRISEMLIGNSPFRN